MKRDVYNIVVLRAASETVLDDDDRLTAALEPAAEAIRRFPGQVAQGIVMAHISHRDLPFRTAKKLADMVGCQTIMRWNYWSDETEFGERVVASCSRRQLFVFVGHEPAVNNILLMAGQPISTTERPQLQPYTLQLTVTRSLFRGTRYKLA